MAALCRVMRCWRVRTHYSYDGTPGTNERAAREYEHHEKLVQRAGGSIAAYMMGCVWHDNSRLTDCNRCDTMLRDKHHQETPGTAA